MVVDLVGTDDRTRRLSCGGSFRTSAGRTAGLYFVYDAVDDSRRAFAAWVVHAGARRRRGLQRLVSGFAQCYPPHSTAYPFVVRSYDPALLLLEVDLADDGARWPDRRDRSGSGRRSSTMMSCAAGPMSDERRDRRRVAGERLCGALAEHRGAGVCDAARRASHVSRRLQAARMAGRRACSSRAPAPIRRCSWRSSAPACA